MTTTTLEFCHRTYGVLHLDLKWSSPDSVSAQLLASFVPQARPLLLEDEPLSVSVPSILAVEVEAFTYQASTEVSTAVLRQVLLSEEGDRRKATGRYQCTSNGKPVWLTLEFNSDSQGRVVLMKVNRRQTVAAVVLSRPASPAPSERTRVLDGLTGPFRAMLSADAVERSLQAILVLVVTMHPKSLNVSPPTLTLTMDREHNVLLFQLGSEWSHEYLNSLLLVEPSEDAVSTQDSRIRTRLFWASILALGESSLILVPQRKLGIRRVSALSRDRSCQVVLHVDDDNKPSMDTALHSGAIDLDLALKTSRLSRDVFEQVVMDERLVSSTCLCVVVDVVSAIPDDRGIAEYISLHCHEPLPVVVKVGALSGPVATGMEGITQHLKSWHQAAVNRDRAHILVGRWKDPCRPSMYFKLFETSPMLMSPPSTLHVGALLPQDGVLLVHSGDIVYMDADQDLREVISQLLLQLKDGVGLGLGVESDDCVKAEAGPDADGIVPLTNLPELLV
jgi:hypothetical protein